MHALEAQQIICRSNPVSQLSTWPLPAEQPVFIARMPELQLLAQLLVVIAGYPFAAVLVSGSGWRVRKKGFRTLESTFCATSTC
jgi:hypothetical protein